MVIEYVKKMLGLRSEVRYERKDMVLTFEDED